MRGALAILPLLGAVALAGGCGGSSGSSTTSAGTEALTSTVPTSTVPTTAVPTSTNPRGSGASPKVDKAPRYALPTAAAPLRSGLVNVAYRHITIAPDTLRVTVGSTIRWTNYDPVEHNVTSQGGVQKFASKNFREGGTFQIQVNRPGIIHYLCTIHPTSMNGTIEVVR